MGFKSAGEDKGTRTCYVHRVGLCHLGGTRGQMDRMECVLEGREEVCVPEHSSLALSQMTKTKVSKLSVYRTKEYRFQAWRVTRSRSELVNSAAVFCGKAAATVCK